MTRAWLLAAATALPLAAHAQAANPALTVLLGQAAYWRAHGQPDQAAAALRRALELDPANADALAQQAQDAADRGDLAAARAALAKLKSAQPDDPRVAMLEQSLNGAALNPSALAQARALALSGKAAEAVAAYQRLFKGSAPPPALATEYYQTLSGTPNGQAAALAGLAAALRSNPDDLHAQLAYAQTLTIRDTTRAAGLERLAALSRTPELTQPAQDAWREALLWSGNSPQIMGQIDAYLDRFPADADMARRRAILAAAAPDPAAKLRATGYQAMQEHRNADAERVFADALAQNPDDVDALAMLAILRREQGRGREAQALLDRALALAPDRRNELLAATSVPAHPGPSATAIRGAYAQVNQLADAGDYPAAEAALRKLMGPRPAPGSLVQLGYIQLRAGDLASAEASFRQALGGRQNAAAQAGLAALRGLQQAQADGLRDQAHRAESPDEKARLYRLAIAQDPANPWLRLDFARALLAARQPGEARAVMAPVLDAAHPSADTARAALYYADSAGDDALVLTLAAHLPPRDRTPELAGIVRRAEVAQDLRDARSQPSLAAMRDRMLDLAANPDPTGARAAAFAQELTRRGDKPGARAVIRAALTGDASPTAEQRIAYAGALVAAGFPKDAEAITAALAPTELNPLQRSTLASVQTAAAVERADQLNDAGDAAAAYDQLAPRLAQDPQNPDLNMALARLYQARQRPRTAVQIDESLLKTNPDDLSVHVAAISAALSAGELGHASQLAQDTKRLFPDEPGAWMAAAQVARGRGDNGGALADLRTARRLRVQQLSGAPGGSPTAQAEPGAARYAAYQAPGIASDASPLPQAVAGEPVTRSYERVAQSTPDPALDAFINPPAASVPRGTRPVTTVQDGLGSNPFRTAPQATPDEPDSLPTLPGEVQAKQPPDAITAEIDSSINEVSSDVAPTASASLSLRGRSGPSGLASLYDLTAPLEATYSPGGYGRLKLAVTPEYLDAGNTAANNLAQFGTNPLAPAGTALRHGASSAAGVALALGYSYGDASADIGTTPLGFQLTNVVGGVELAPHLTDGLTLRATLDRRAVTDSLLSYGGETDARTGASWGGVTRDHAHLQLEGAKGGTTYYAGAGGGLLTGQNVRTNTEIDAGAGFGVPVWSTGSQEIRTGLDLVYFSYDRNLQNFTFGSGGYFSPQNFVAGLIPITYRQTVSPDLSFSVGGSLGVQSFSEKSTPVFQEGGLQQSLLGLAALQPGTTTTLSGTQTTGLSGGAHAEIDYRALQQLHIGAKAGFDRSGNFTEGTGLVYARYVFSGW